MQNFVLKIQYININITALRLLQMNMSEYGFCYIASEYQKINGWCEAGVGNHNKTVTSLKYYIGQLCGLSESGTNKLFKRLLKSGFVEKGDNKFRLTPKYFVLQHSSSESPEAQEMAKKVDRVLKKGFSEWNIAKKDEFTTFVNSLKFNDVNIDYYFTTISQHYTQENTAPMSEEGYKRKIRQWLWGDYSAGKLRITQQAKGKNIENINIENTFKEFLRYRTLIIKPNEHTTLQVFKENVDTFMQFGDKLKYANAFDKEGADTYHKEREFYNRMKETPGATKQVFTKRMACYQQPQQEKNPTMTATLNNAFGELAKKMRDG